MIALYPMLVSNTVSKNIIPGISKVLENFLIVYGMRDIMEKARGDRAIKKGMSAYSFKKRLTIKESDNYVEDFFYREVIFEQSQINQYTDPGTKRRQQTGSQRRQYPGTQPVSDPTLARRDAEADAYEQAEKYKDTERMSRAKEKGKLAAKEKDPRDASVSITPFDMKSISLEPTWMKTDIITKDGMKTSGIVGVKVVPYPVKSDAKLSQLLMYDRQVNNLQGLVIRRGRAIENLFYRAWKILWKVGTLGFGGGSTGGSAVSGNPKHDILAKRTILKANDASDIFVLVNKADLVDDFESSAAGILNLFRMGWSSIIIADDVNKRVSFCMRELKGMCSMMPYTMMYQTFQQAKVYDDLEDAKRSASSIFKMRREKFSKIVGEGVAQNKIEEFGIQNLPLFENEILSEINYIDENIGSFVKSLTPAKIKSVFLNIVKGNTKNAPNVSPDKLLKIGSKANPNFRKSYLLAKKVIANSSPEIKNNKVIELAAISIASKAVIETSKDIGKDILVSTKEGIKTFIRNYRKNKEGISPPDKMPVEHYAEATFGWIAILGTMSIITVSYTKLLMPFIKRLPDHLSWLGSTVLPKLKNTIQDMFSGTEGVLKTVKDWDVTTASTPEIGLFFVIGMMASYALLAIITPAILPKFRRR